MAAHGWRRADGRVQPTFEKEQTVASKAERGVE